MRRVPVCRFYLRCSTVRLGVLGLERAIVRIRVQGLKVLTVSLRGLSAGRSKILVSVRSTPIELRRYVCELFCF